MQPQEFDTILQQTLSDLRLSRGEKQVLRGVLGDLVLDEPTAALYRRRAFELARDTLATGESRKVLDWLEDVVKVLHQCGEKPAAGHDVEVCFSPGDNCPGRIASLLHAANSKIDICVFTITDDRISSAILAAHQRKVRVRIITDDEKVTDAGSDIVRLEDAGIPVRIDRTQFHMHHKYALFDEAKLLTGSYNWTRGAAEYNMENFLVTGDGRLVQRYQAAFEGLWQRLS